VVTFLVIAGMIVWSAATVALLLGGVAWAADADGWVQGASRIALGIVFAALSGTGVGMTIAANGWFDDTTLPDGCYAVSHDTQLMPMMVGKVVTVIPYDNTNFAPIACPR
jgi:hypothetical protein